MVLLGLFLCPVFFRLFWKSLHKSVFFWCFFEREIWVWFHACYHFELLNNPVTTEFWRQPKFAQSGKFKLNGMTSAFFAFFWSCLLRLLHLSCKQITLWSCSVLPTNLVIWIKRGDPGKEKKLKRKTISFQGSPRNQTGGSGPPTLPSPCTKPMLTWYPGRGGWVWTTSKSGGPGFFPVAGLCPYCVHTG